MELRFKSPQGMYCITLLQCLSLVSVLDDLMLFGGKFIYIVLHHQVSDGALRCFASLADRFTRRGVDPAPLAKHGLTEELLSRMAAAGGTVSGPSSACKPGRSTTGAPSAAADSKLSNQVSTIVSLLSTLCRGSPLVTHVRTFFYLLFFDLLEKVFLYNGKYIRCFSPILFLGSSEVRASRFN